MIKKQNQIWVDYVRVFATFCVVFLHSSGTLLTQFNKLPEINWWISNFYNAAVRICVPLFFMISGYLLLESNENLKEFFKKRINKVLIPLLAWSLIYVFWKAYGESSSQLSFSSLCSIAISPAYYHLWFLYAIIGIYLFMPILRVVVNNADRTMLFYYSLLWFIAVSFIPLISKVTGINSSIDLKSISGFSGYLVIGLLLGKYRASTKVAIASGTVFIACTAIASVGTYLLTINNKGVLYPYFHDNLSPTVIIASAAALVFTKYLIENNDIFKQPAILSILQSLSAASLGIYLIHPIFLHLLRFGKLGFALSGFVGNPIYSIPATTVAAFLLSYFSIVIIKKIPLINRIAP
jgi:surface polysaccharide O-acyltransferase-like enzyme